jgi:hypothetical protein
MKLFLAIASVTSLLLAVGLPRAGAIENGTREKPQQTNLKPGEYVWEPQASPTGSVDIVISLGEQKLYVYRDGVQIGRSTISSGSKGRETPKGIYMILEKNLTHHSNKYHEASMPYMERLTWGGLAVHAGNTPGHPESHGCVHVPMGFAKQLYTTTQEGNTVLIADRNGKPRTTSDPNLLFAVAPGDSPAPEASPAASPEASPEPSSTPTASPAPGSPAPDASLPAPPAADASAPGSPPPDASPAPAPTPAFLWDPKKVPSGPLTIAFSSADKRVYVYRKGVEIGRAELSGPDAGKSFGNYVYVALAQTLPDGSHQWSLLGSVDGPPSLNLQAFANSSTLPAEFRQRMREIIVPGTTLVITDHPANPSKPSNPD